MKPNQILISALQMVRTKESMVKQLISKNITAIGYELIRDDEGALPIIVDAESNIVRASIQGPEWGYRLIDIDGSAVGANPPLGATLTLNYTDGLYVRVHSVTIWYF